LAAVERPTLCTYGSRRPRRHDSHRLRGERRVSTPLSPCPSIIVPAPKGTDGPCVRHGGVKGRAAVWCEVEMGKKCDEEVERARISEYRGSPRNARNGETPVCNTKTSTTCNSTNMGSIEAALAAIEPLELGEKLVYAQIARKYGVEPTTLARRHKGASTSLNTRFENQQALHPQQELELLRYIERLTERGLPPTRAMIRSFPSHIAQRELGVHWVDRFVQRFPHELISK
jgi:hypothetical protein